MLSVNNVFLHIIIINLNEYETNFLVDRICEERILKIKTD